MRMSGTKKYNSINLDSKLELRKSETDEEKLIEDVWLQFGHIATVQGKPNRNDGALSTLSSVRSYLLQKNIINEHGFTLYELDADGNIDFNYFRSIYPGSETILLKYLKF